MHMYCSNIHLSTYVTFQSNGANCNLYFLSKKFFCFILAFFFFFLKIRVKKRLKNGGGLSCGAGKAWLLLSKRKKEKLNHFARGSAVGSAVRFYKVKDSLSNVE